MDVCYVWMCVELFHMDVCGIVPYGCVWNCYVWICVDLVCMEWMYVESLCMDACGIVYECMCNCVWMCMELLRIHVYGIVLYGCV